MLEIDIDISKQRSKGLKEFEGIMFDYVITVCGGEDEVCPFFPGGKIISTNHLKTPQNLQEAKMRN